MSRASGTDRVSRSSFGTMSVSPRRTAQSLIEFGACAMGTGQAVIHVDAIRGAPQFHERPLLGGQILSVGRAPHIANQGLGHIFMLHV